MVRMDELRRAERNAAPKDKSTYHQHGAERLLLVAPKYQMGPRRKSLCAPQKIKRALVTL